MAGFGAVRLLALLVGLSWAQNAVAQLVTAEEKGIAANTAFSGSDVDLVNLQNGNLHIEIPIYKEMQRGGTVLKWTFMFDSQTWLKQWIVNNCGFRACSPPGHYDVTQHPSVVSSWRLTKPGDWEVINQGSGGICPSTGQPYAATVQWAIVDPTGAQHPLPLNVEDASLPCNGNTTSGPTLDGSGMFYDSTTNIIYLKDGTQITPGQIKDANGNLFDITNGIDANGRTPVVNADVGITTYTTPLNVQINGPQYSTYTIVDSSGASQSYRLDYQAIDVLSDGCTWTHTGSAPCTEGGEPTLEPSRLTLPDGRAYVFTFVNNSPGELSRLDLPTGAYVTYSYADFYQVQFQHGLNPNYAGGPGVTQRVVHVDGTTQTWTYTRTASATNVVVQDPLGNTATHLFGPVSVGSGGAMRTSSNLFETSVAYADSVGSILRTVTNDYTAELDPLHNTVANVRSIRETTTLDNGQVSKRETDFDTFTYSCPTSGCGTPTATRKNVAEERVYDFGSGGAGSLIRRTHFTYLHDLDPTDYLPRNIVGKPTVTEIYNGSGTLMSRLTYEYDVYSHTGQSIQSSSAIHHDVGYGTGFTKRGNRTAQSMWRDTDGGASISTYQYDDAGNILSVVDPNGNKTSYSYADSWETSHCVPSGVVAGYVSQVTNAKLQTTSAKHDACTGLLASSTDLNGQVTTYAYDFMNRQAVIVNPDGGAKTFCYSDDASGSCYSAGSLSVTETTKLSSTSNSLATTLFDGLGRPKQQQLNSDPGGTTYVDTQYDLDGRVSQTSNPYRSGEPLYWTVNHYDGVARLIGVTKPDNTATSMMYSGNTTTSADEAGNRRKSQTDSLGRLTGVWEDPLSANYETDYEYDALGNLKTVTQRGGSASSSNWRIRDFTYDSLSRLITAKNPESGTTCYGQWNGTNCINGYDAGGNMLYKTDARGFLTTYTYDVLNRLTFKHYSDGTLVSAFGYDGYEENGNVPPGGVPPYAVGRLSTISNQVNSATVFGYDKMGRTAAEHVCVPSDCSFNLAVSAGYDLAGNLTQLTYPDGRSISQAFDSSGRLGSVWPTTSSATPYVSSITYNADGSPHVQTFGNNVQKTTTENLRLQVQSVTVASTLPYYGGYPFLSHDYCYSGCATGGSANNGNIWGITDTINGSKTQGFTYDALNRISSFFVGGTNNQQYSIDPFGNMSRLSGSTAQTTFDAATNRINNLPCASSVTSFDNAGNQLCDTDTNGGVRQYQYDAENRIRQIASLGSSTPFETYTYDANGARVRKTNADGSFTEYLNFGGVTLAEKTEAGWWTDYVYANGKKIARVASSVPLWHMHADRTAVSHPEWGVEGPVYGTPAALAGTVLSLGDKLILDFKQIGVPSYGGVALIFTDNTGAGDLVDETDSTPLWFNGNADGNWHHLVASLDGYANKTVAYAYAGLHNSMPAGVNDTWIANMAIVQHNGTVIPIYSGQQNLAVGWSNGGAANGLYSGTDIAAADSDVATNYYMGDHLGSLSLELTNGGWPIWKGEFAPFGQELSAPTTAMRYKFTDKERDSETGNDYFGARYYTSSLGRFMTPDWAEKATAVPYAKFGDPQTLNLYAYVENGPVNNVDADGHALVGGPSGTVPYLSSKQGDSCRDRQDQTHCAGPGTSGDPNPSAITEDDLAREEAANGQNQNGKAQQQNSTQRSESAAETHAKRNMQRYGGSQPADNGLSISPVAGSCGNGNHNCQYSLSGAGSEGLYVYEHQTSGVLGGQQVGDSDYVTPGYGGKANTGIFYDDIGGSNLDTYRFFTVSKSPTYNPANQMVVPIRESGGLIGFEHMYSNGGAVYINGSTNISPQN